MDYSTKTKNLFKEIRGGIQYKKLSAIFKIIAVIGVLPFWIAGGLLYVAYAIINFTFNLLSSGTKYLEEWVKQTKRDVSTLTEAVIYFVTTPVIFTFQVLLSLLSTVFFLNWFLMQCAFYIASLGGIRWCPYIAYDKEDTIDDYTATTNELSATVTTLLAATLFLIVIIITAANTIEYGTVKQEISTIFSGLYWLVSIIVIPIVFKKATTDEHVMNAKTKNYLIDMNTTVSEDGTVISTQNKNDKIEPILITVAAAILVIFTVIISISANNDNNGNNGSNNSSYDDSSNNSNVDADGSSFDKAITLTSSGYTFTPSRSYIYFEFSPESSGNYTFSSTSSEDINAAFYNETKSMLKSDFTYGDFSITEYLQYGKTYYIAVKCSSLSTSLCRLTVVKKQ